jgi:hypothetical protein
MRTFLAAIAIALVGQGALQRSIYERDYQLDFQVTQGTTCTGPSSNDQITIVFSNVPADKVTPTPAVLGEDVISEFSFSARDIVKNELVFRRRVRDRSFLDARYIRVVNLSGDGWCGGSLTLAIDGRRLFKAPLDQGSKGIQDWNRSNWRERSYWEAPLQQFVPPTLAK